MILAVLLSFGLAHAGEQTIQLSAPALTEEDQYSLQLPPQYRCNACHGVRHKLKAASANVKKATEIVLISLYEETCKSKNFQGYGISLINGSNVFTGPGIEVEQETSAGGSIQMGGEAWNRRLGSLCTEIVEEIGETELYGKIKRDENFCSSFCPKQRTDL
jgi:hypothetical protein